MTVYLLHFDRPLRHAQHYVGWCAGDPVKRLAEHVAGNGGKLTAAASASGIAISIAKVWNGAPRAFERFLKDGSHKRRCPICRPDDCHNTAFDPSLDYGAILDRRGRRRHVPHGVRAYLERRP
jgi:hypothetical protein